MVGANGERISFSINDFGVTPAGAYLSTSMPAGSARRDGWSQGSTLDANALTIESIKAWLGERELSARGNKAELADRMERAAIALATAESGIARP